MIGTVIFDVDGTLLDTEKIYMQAWRQAGALFGYHIPDEALKKTRAVSSKIAIQTFCSFCGEDFPYKDIQKERVRIAEEIIGASSPEQLHKPGVLRVLRDFTKAGYRMAVASSTGSEKTVEHLRHAELLDWFPVVVGGDMVELGKPEPDIFLKAAQMSGATPDECVVIGDTPADVFAGTAARMRVVLIPDQVPANEQTIVLSSRVLSGLNELTVELLNTL